MDDHEVEVSRITITRTFTTDGDDMVNVDTEGDLKFIEAMGMLVMAEQILTERHRD